MVQSPRTLHHPIPHFILPKSFYRESSVFASASAFRFYLRHPLLVSPLFIRGIKGDSPLLLLMLFAFICVIRFYPPLSAVQIFASAFLCAACDLRDSVVNPLVPFATAFACVRYREPYVLTVILITDIKIYPHDSAKNLIISKTLLCLSALHSCFENLSWSAF